MLMVTWSPLSGTPLLEASEEEVNLSLSVSASTEGGDAVITSFTLDQPAEIFTGVISGSNLTLTAPNLIGLFEIIHIKYRLNNVIGVCYRWEDLPPEAEELISYRKTRASVRTFTLTVTGEGTDGIETTPTSSTTNYELIIRANYTAGRIALIAEVNKRR